MSTIKVDTWQTTTGGALDFNTGVTISSGNLLIGRTSSTVGQDVKLDVNGGVNAASVLTTGNLLIGRTSSTVGQGVKLDIVGAINCSNILVNGAIYGGAATYNSNVGNNSANTFTITHNLNKQFVIPAVRENSTGYYVYPDIKYNDLNSIILQFVTAPTTNQYCVIILG